MRRAPAASLLLVALLVAACGSDGASAGTGASAAPATSGAATSVPAASSATSPASSGTPSLAPSSSSEPAPASPDGSAAGSASAAPSDSATPVDSASPSPSASGVALACQPEGSNPNFWPGIAASVSWDVYCAVLPKGWSVASGKYRLANGGYLVIGYKGPGGATLTLSEGWFCSDGSGCAPSGSDSGAASLGSMAGTLITTDAGGFAIVAARGQQPSWLMVTSGLDQATTVALGAALAPVAR